MQVIVPQISRIDPLIYGGRTLFIGFLVPRCTYLPVIVTFRYNTRVSGTNTSVFRYKNVPMSTYSCTYG
jgi:hypothetical protein